MQKPMRRIPSMTGSGAVGEESWRIAVSVETMTLSRPHLRSSTADSGSRTATRLHFESVS